MALRLSFQQETTSEWTLVDTSVDGRVHLCESGERMYDTALVNAMGKGLVEVGEVKNGKATIKLIKGRSFINREGFMNFTESTNIAAKAADVVFG